MKTSHILHRHGGRILSLDSIAHATHRTAGSRRAAYWEFVGTVEWDDGTKSEAAHIDPRCLIIDDDNRAESEAEVKAALRLLSEYLAQHGTWGDDGNWKPEFKTGSAAI